MYSRGIRDISVFLMQFFTPTEDDEARTASGSSSSSLLAHFIAVRPTRCCCCGRMNLEGTSLFVLVLSCGGLRCSGLAGCPPLALTGLALPWWLPCPSHPPSSPSDDSSLSLSLFVNNSTAYYHSLPNPPFPPGKFALPYPFAYALQAADDA